jgi:hypothetical protein
MPGRNKTGISEADFSSLLAAISATAKGRAFLDEYRRRYQPYETLSLIDSLKQIESTVDTMRDELKPHRIAGELQNIAMTLDIALDGVEADPEGGESARRFALAGRARQELQTLARSLADGITRPDEDQPPLR